LLTDLLNSTVALTDPNGAVKQQYSYDPYGNVTPSDMATGFTNPYQFTGREADAPGLYYYRARYYSPQLMGFLSEDPIAFRGGQLSFYAYAAADPVYNDDPTGLIVKVVASDPVVAQTLMNAYAYLNAHSSTARSINDDLEKSSTVYKIEPTNDMDNDEYCPTNDTLGCEGHAHTVFVDICDFPLIPTTEGMQPVTLPVLIGHELGHAWGYEDNTTATDPLGDNVRMVENPIRHELGLPLRTRY
jgi:RHS repeat-associated protein